MKPEQERIRSLLVDTISLLCRNGLSFENELRVQAVIGITVDKEECLVVHVNKCFERQTVQEEDCENEEELKESLQQLASQSNAAELESSQNAIKSATALMQPTRDAPPSPRAESPQSITKLSGSQVLSTSCHETNGSQHRQHVSANNLSRDNCTSTSDIGLYTGKSCSSKHEPIDDCEEFNGSKTRARMSKIPVPLPIESDECDDSSEMTTDSVMLQQNSVATEQRVMNDAGMQQRPYDCSKPMRPKPRPCVDAYRPKPKRQNLCEDLYDAVDDYCTDFTVGQQYMYIDSGRSRAKPKVPKQQKYDVIFDPHCTPSMMGYGTQDVRLLILNRAMS